ncbi:MAG: class I SAM-dependent methyltransferase [Planctomycetes bacterium]|nr:class I SAM-dependent methyltransferase [Planctomycetota bacterium]
MQREGYQVTSDYEATHWWYLSRRDLVLSQVEIASTEIGFPSKELSLLDYGCGTGFFLQFLAKFGNASGADVAEESLVEFQKSAGFPLYDLSREAEALYGRFDVVTALDVLEHIEDDVSGLIRMKRCLAPGGRLILTVPAYEWLWSGEDVISGHVRRYTISGMKRVFRKAGMTCEFISYFNMSVLPAIAAVVYAKRIFSPEKAQHSNLKHEPRWLNSLLYKITSAEARRIGAGRLRMPAGASIVARLRAKV